MSQHEEQQPVITDEMRGFIGMRSIPVTYTVEKHAVERFAAAIGDANPLYSNSEKASTSSHGRLIAPPTFYRSLLPGAYPEEFPEPFAHILDGGSKYRHRRPAKVGEEITVVRELKNLFSKSGRMGEMLFKVAEISYLDSSGDLVATQETTTITYGQGEPDDGVRGH